jgi:very-short-patch-repair endonuclease
MFADGIKEADLLFRRHRVWIELDHHKHHGADPAQTMKDHQRDREIRAADFDLARFTDYEFAHARAAIRAHIEELLSAAARPRAGR